MVLFKRTEESSLDKDSSVDKETQNPILRTSFVIDRWYIYTNNSFVISNPMQSWFTWRARNANDKR